MKIIKNFQIYSRKKMLFFVVAGKRFLCRNSYKLGRPRQVMTPVLFMNLNSVWNKAV